MTTTLDEAAIRELLETNAVGDIEKLEVFREIDSTNSYLRDHPPPARGTFRVAMADHQTAGRGRRGNKWVSAPGRSLCLSVAHTFGETPANLPALTLALGVGTVDVLRDFGTDDVRLKWPNDLLAADAKLGGILTETYHRREGTVVVAGIGLNVNLPDRIDEDIESAYALRAVDLHSLLHEPLARETLAAAMVLGWRRTFLEYATGGFARFLSRYARIDWLAGKSVVVRSGETRLEGLAKGVSPAGELLVETRDGTVAVVSGSILAAERM